MLTDNAILALIQEDTEIFPDFPSLTKEAAIIAQSKHVNAFLNMRIANKKRKFDSKL